MFDARLRVRPSSSFPASRGAGSGCAGAATRLQRRCRAITYSLCGDIGSGMQRRSERSGSRTTSASSTRSSTTGRLTRAALCGVSYGGFIALRYAATRPERVVQPDPGVGAGAGLDAVTSGSSATSRARGSTAPLFVADGAGTAVAGDRGGAADVARRGCAFAVRHGGRGSCSRRIDPVADGRRVSSVQQATGLQRRLRARARADAGHHRRGRPRSRRAACGHAAVSLDQIPGARYATLERHGPHRHGHAAGTVRAASSATSSMPTITDLTGPAGRLEALLDLPAGRRRRRRAGARGGRLRAPASAVRRDDAHEGGLSGREGARAASAARCCASTSAASAQRGHLRSGRRREGRLQRRRSTTWRRGIPALAAVGRGVLVRRVGRARGRRRRRSRVGADRHRAAVATSVSGMKYEFPTTLASDEAEVLRPGRSRRGLSDRGDVDSSTRSCRSRRSWSSSTPPIICSTARRRRSARRSRTCWRDSESWMKHAEAHRHAGECRCRRSHRLGRAHTGRQGAGRRAALHAAGRDGGGRRSARRLRARPGLDPAEVEDVILGCAMPEAEQGLNVARIASLRAGVPVSASAVTVNRFCSSGLQAIAYAAERIMAGFGDAPSPAAPSR